MLISENELPAAGRIELIGTSPSMLPAAATTALSARSTCVAPFSSSGYDKVDERLPIEMLSGIGVVARRRQGDGEKPDP